MQPISSHMERKKIIEVLKRWNAWERSIDSGFPRPRYVDRIYSYLARKEAIVLTGIRRAGKSTIMRQLMDRLVRNGVAREQLLYLNLEDYAFADALRIELLEEVFSAYLQHTKNRSMAYFFIDEIQHIPGWEKWVRTKYDLGEPIRFVLTGSSAALLAREFSTLLTGRTIAFTILPLSFSEFCVFRRNQAIDEYLRFGGFPEVVLEESEEKKLTLLQQYFTDILHRDIIDRHTIRNAQQCMALARYLVSTSGGKVSLNKLARVFGLSNDTIATYISYLVDAHLLYEVTYFSHSAKIKHDVTKRSKFYAIDHGLISAVSGTTTRNTGQRYEIAVLAKLLDTHREISYWGAEHVEVDFVVGALAINVTATDALAPREERGLEAFQKEHKGFSPLLITPSTSKRNAVALPTFLLGDAAP